MSAEGHDVETSESFEDAVGKLSLHAFDLIIADIVLGNKSGVDLLREVKNRNMRCPVVMITGVPSLDTAAESVRLGAFDYISKPFRKDDLMRITRLALEHKDITDKMESYRRNLEAIFRSVKDAIITVDEGLNIIEINDAARGICNLTRDMIGHGVEKVKSGCFGQCIGALKECAAKGRAVELNGISCRLAQIPGKHRQQIVNLTAYPLMDEQGKGYGIVMVVRDVTRLERLERDLSSRQGLHRLIGQSKGMQEVYSLIETLSGVQTSVLITGESGTGKELAAEAIHYIGKGASGKPMVKVNCSAISEHLLESEMFGHVKGAFTGAISDKIGRFELAHGGTIFLDEVGDIPLSMQSKLLRVLQEREFERVGDTKPVKVDVRVIAATNRDLMKMVKRGLFRSDLYYRLRVVELALPALRDRKEDIPILIKHFMEKFNDKLNRTVTGVSGEVERLFMHYNWPGNIRELEHVLEHAMIVSRGPVIEIESLPDEFRQPADIRHVPDDEPATIMAALTKSGWNKAEAARLLGISRPTLYRKIIEFKLSRD